MNIKLFILLILLAFTIIALIYMCNTENFTNSKEKMEEEEVPNVKRPFVNVYDNNGKKLNVILISKPFRDDSELKIYEKHKNKNIFIGITSYLEFPNMPSNPFEDFNENFKKFK